MKKRTIEMLTVLSVLVALFSGCSSAVKNTEKVEKDLIGTTWFREIVMWGETVDYYEYSFDRNNVVRIDWDESTGYSTQHKYKVYKYEVDDNSIYIYNDNGTTAMTMDWEYKAGKLQLVYRGTGLSKDEKTVLTTTRPQIKPVQPSQPPQS